MLSTDSIASAVGELLEHGGLLSVGGAPPSARRGPGAAAPETYPRPAMEHLGLLGLADSGHASLFAALTGQDADRGERPSPRAPSRSPTSASTQLAKMSESKQVVPATLQLAYLPGLSTEAGKGLGSRLLGSVRDCDALMLVVQGRRRTRRREGAHRARGGADPRRPRVGRVARRQAAPRGEGRQDASRRRSRRSSAPRRRCPTGRRSTGRISPTTTARCSAPAFLLTNKPALVVVNIGVDQLGCRRRASRRRSARTRSRCCLELEGDPDVVRRAGEERAAAARRARDPGERRAAARPRRRCTCSGAGRSSRRVTRSRAPGRSGPASTAPECAGVIHSDLQRGFIRAEVIVWQELLDIGSWTKAKDAG